MTVSRAETPVRGCLSTGMPRPLSPTVTTPSPAMPIEMELQWPAMASSTELSTIS